MSHSPPMEGPAPDLASLATEQSNPASSRLDEMSSLEIVRLMNDEDARVAAAVRSQLEPIAQLVDRIADRLRAGGRLFYVGAGTSGRLGTLDSVECPPTFSVDDDLVQSIMAGGPDAWRWAREGAEDSEPAGAAAITEAGVTPSDIVVGVAASGRTPFVIGAVRAARAVGAATGAIANQPGSLLGAEADIRIEVPVGPEVLTGSTRLKAGTAQKMVLNMLSTAVMVRLGKTYGNRMVDVRASNQKLRDRARRMVADIAGVGPDQATAFLEAAGGSAKTAILMARIRCDRLEAEQSIARHGGSLRAALQAAGLE